MPLHPWPPSENSLKPTCTPKHIHPSLNHPPGVLRGVRPLLCPWTQNFVDCFLFCCALESSCLGRLSAIKVQLELELLLQSEPLCKLISTVEHALSIKDFFIALIHLTYQTIAIARRQPVPPNERKRRPGFHPRQDRHTTIHSPGGLVPASLARGT